MSNRYLNWAFELGGVSPTEKLVLVKLADQANDDGKCWPSQSTLAKHCCMSRESVNRIIKRLAEANFIEIISRVREGVNLPNVYQLPPYISVGGSDAASQGVVTQDHRGSDAASQKPSYNPQLEPSLLPPQEAADARPQKKRRKPEEPLPENFPDAKLKDLAAEIWKQQGLSIDVEVEADRFRDHHTSRDTRFRDWSAGWRTWVRNAAEFAKARGGASGDAPRDRKVFSGKTVQWD